MPIYLQMSTGYIARPEGSGYALAGSCAAYRYRHALVTAAHCVPDLGLALFVVLPGDEPRPVREVVVHPDSDLAVLFAEPRDLEPLSEQVYVGTDATLTEGGDFMAFGYPVEGEAVAVPRLFKGHFQRYFGYSDAAGRNYFAGELSVPAPAGLSGGPVVNPREPSRLAAVVTTNVESYVVLDSLEEVERDGKTLRIESRRVVSYGIAAMLTSAGAWIDAVIDVGQTPLAGGEGDGRPLWRTQAV